MTKLTVYEISEALEQLAEDLERESGTDDADVAAILFARISALDLAVVDKIDGITALRMSLVALADGRKAEAERMAGRARISTNAVRRLDHLVMCLLDAAGTKSVDTPRFRVWVAGNGGPVPIVQTALPPGESIPAKFIDERTEITRRPNIERIRAALLDGESVPGYTLSTRGRHVRVS